MCRLSAHVAEIEADAAMKRLLGRGEGWVAWIEASIEHGVSRCFSIEADDPNVIRTIKIGEECETGDVAALLSAVARYSESERTRAVAAIEALEADNG